MTVKELINTLSKQNPDAEITMTVAGAEQWWFVDGLRRREFGDNGRIEIVSENAPDFYSIVGMARECVNEYGKLLDTDQACALLDIADFYKEKMKA
jgi:hypothetical protein